MKQYIVLMSLILLGVFIFKLILGSGDGSILSAIGEVFRGEIERISN